MTVHTELGPTEAADRLASRELFDAYAHCADRRDAEGQKALFVDDYVFAVCMDGEGTSAGRSGVSEGKISWPTRGPNVDWTIGSTMRRRADWWIKKPCK
jgi:SnoaL-like domain